MTVTTLVLLPKWSTLSSMMSECVHRRWGTAGGVPHVQCVCVCVCVCVGVLTGPSSC